jgi:hypothetical protein
MRGFTHESGVRVVISREDAGRSGLNDSILGLLSFIKIKKG